MQQNHYSLPSFIRKFEEVRVIPKEKKETPLKELIQYGEALISLLQSDIEEYDKLIESWKENGVENDALIQLKNAKVQEETQAKKLFGASQIQQLARLAWAEDEERY